MDRIARLVGLNVPQETTERTQSVSEVWASMSCWHRGNSTLCGVIAIVANDGKVVTKDYTRLILSCAGMETLLFFSGRRNLSRISTTADSLGYLLYALFGSVSCSLSSGIAPPFLCIPYLQYRELIQRSYSCMLAQLDHPTQDTKLKVEDSAHVKGYHRCCHI